MRWPWQRKGVGDMPYADESHWVPIGGGQTRIVLPGSRRDWAIEAGDVWRNSAAAIGINWIAQSFPEAPLVVADDTRDGKRVLHPEHPLSVLWRRPNTLYSGSSMTSVIILSLLCKGDAYMQRINDRTGTPTQLWWLPHWVIKPAGTPTEPLTHYDLRNPDGTVTPLPVDEVVHIRYGLDPLNPREGLGPLLMVLREIVTDNEAATYIVSLMASAGIGGIVMTDRDPNTSVNEDDARRIKAKLTAETEGDKRFNVVYVPAQVNIERMAFSPNDMAVDQVTQQAIARIFAVLNLSPMACGLPDPQKTYANAKEARRGAWENSVLPLMSRVGEELDFGLLPAFGARPGQHCVFNTVDVRALQDDRNARDDNARKNFTAGIWTRAEAREETGRQWKPEDEVYMSDIVDARSMRVAEAAAKAPPAIPPEPPKGIRRQIAAKAEETGTEVGDAETWAERVIREIEALHAASAE